MPRERNSKHDKYAENLIPTLVTITRRRGIYTYVFEIEGYRGEETGEIYYKRDAVLAIEQYLGSNHAIKSISLNNVGLVLNFQTPHVIVSEGLSTGTALRESEIYKVQPQSQFTRSNTLGLVGA